VSALDRAVADLGEVGQLPPRLGQISRGLAALSEEHRHRAGGAVASDLSRRLGEAGLTLSGHFPRLACGVFTIEFSSGEKPTATLWFGPRIDRIGTAPPSAEAIANALLAAYRDLEADEFSEEAHLETLRDAYGNACRLGGLSDGGAVPIGEVMLQTAILRQRAAFRSDPVRGHFADYGRVRFAFDLGRTTRREIGGHELRLTVASMEQTRRRSGHLWVPRGPRDARGTHYALLAFRQVGG